MPALDLALGRMTAAKNCAKGFDKGSPGTRQEEGKQSEGENVT